MRGHDNCLFRLDLVLLGRLCRRGCDDLLEKRMMKDMLKKQMDIVAAEEVPSPPNRHDKWNMACTKAGEQMTSEKSMMISKRILFVGGVPHFMAIGRVYPGGSTMHTVPMLDYLVRMVVEDIRDATSLVQMPIGEV
ncbi:hypothetical protein DEO72_LG8g1666 [Vigna unguiculata]|uniref:Uncharacterized protein n=1 Tax=Vigna unguiculata TaxID=3917 RepID=A0A4D6MSM6_VIGUN|nr:hypothetical protein DEO72_LG8g1666 [Vigna unguiculata]